MINKSLIFIINCVCEDYDLLINKEGKDVSMIICTD